VAEVRVESDECLKGGGRVGVERGGKKMNRGVVVQHDRGKEGTGGV
jgi:hypothetical protein